MVWLWKKRAEEPAAKKGPTAKADDKGAQSLISDAISAELEDITKRLGKRIQDQETASQLGSS